MRMLKDVYSVLHGLASDYEGVPGQVHIMQGGGLYAWLDSQPDTLERASDQERGPGHRLADVRSGHSHRPSTLMVIHNLALMVKETELAEQNIRTDSLSSPYPYLY